MCLLGALCVYLNYLYFAYHVFIFLFSEDVSHNRKADRHSAVTDGSTHEIPKALTTSLQSLGLDDFDSCTSDLYSLSQPLDSVRSTSPYETVALQVNGKIKRKSTTPKQPSYQEEKEVSVVLTFKFCKGFALIFK